MLQLPDLAIGAIAAAIIAAIVSLLGLIISKEQKISEFRQNWIDQLRSDLATLIAHAYSIHAALMSHPVDYASLWNSTKEDFFGIYRATASIRLRLNPDEEKEILTDIGKLEQLLLPGQVPDYESLNTIEIKIIQAGQVLLKKEWLRVRSGERTYRITKIITLIVFLFSLVILLGQLVVRVLC